MRHAWRETFVFVRRVEIPYNVVVELVVVGI